MSIPTEVSGGRLHRATDCPALEKSWPGSHQSFLEPVSAAEILRYIRKDDLRCRHCGARLFVDTRHRVTVSLEFTILEMP